jgi:heptosyltransferase-2
MVLTTPLLARLAREGAVDVVATPAAAPLLANHPAVREVIVYDKRKRDRGLRAFARIALRLRRRGYGAAFLAQGSMRSAALALAAGIPRRVGFASSPGRALYTERIAPDAAHHALRLLALAGGAPSPPDESRPRLYPGPLEARAADEVLAGAQQDGERLAVLAPGSVWATKRWPYYADLARLLAPHLRIVIVGGTADGDLARAIAEAAGAARVVDATGRLSLLASAEMIGRAAVLVTNDSAPQHLASAMNTPTVAIFGPTVPEFGFGPLAERRAILGLDDLPCRPCDRHGPRRCPLGHWRCMRDITAAVVAGKVFELIG